MSKQLVRLTTHEKIASQRTHTHNEKEPPYQNREGGKKIMTESQQWPRAEIFYLQLIALKQNPQAV